MPRVTGHPRSPYGAVSGGTVLRRGLVGTPPKAVGCLGRSDGTFTSIPLQVGTEVGVGQGALVAERLHSAGPVAEDDALATGHLEGVGQPLAGLGRRVGIDADVMRRQVPP